MWIKECYSGLLRDSAGFWCLFMRHATIMGGWAGGREYYAPKDERGEHVQNACEE